LQIAQDGDSHFGQQVGVHQQHTRLKAGVLDPYLANASLSPTETPVMMLAEPSETATTVTTPDVTAQSITTAHGLPGVSGVDELACGHFQFSI
jgi:hypothetical protein